MQLPNMYTMIIHESDFSSVEPPAFLASDERLDKPVFTASSASIVLLQVAAIAPVNMNAIPRAQPQRASTYGSDNTPDPIAQAHSEKMLPLTEPLPTFEKVRSMKVLRRPLFGDSI